MTFKSQEQSDFINQVRDINAVKQAKTFKQKKQQPQMQPFSIENSEDQSAPSRTTGEQMYAKRGSDNVLAQMTNPFQTKVLQPQSSN